MPSFRISKYVPAQVLNKQYGILLCLICLIILLRNNSKTELEKPAELQREPKPSVGPAVRALPPAVPVPPPAVPVVPSAVPVQLFDNPALEQDDPRLLEYIRDHRLKKPPQERNTKNTHQTSEWDVQLTTIFGEKKNGFYIECGANDGEFLSNTFYFDKKYEWSGLLIEANRFMLKELYAKGRNAWITDACLAIKPYPQKVEFIHRVGQEVWKRGNGMIKPSGGPEYPTPPPETHDMKEYVSAGEAECFPLYSLLAALNVTTVDYFSLDVEGVEYKILKHIPFDKVTIKVISVEFNVIPEGKAALVDLLARNGYEVMMEAYRELFMVLTKYKHEFGFGIGSRLITDK